MKVRCLTDSGIAHFKDYLTRLREDGGTPPPTGLLTNPKHSVRFEPGEASFEPRNFDSRHAFAEYIDRQFRNAGISEDADQPGLWEWLSLFYLDAVCPANNAGIRKPYHDARHLVDRTSRRRGRRHLLRGAYLLYREYAGGVDGELDLLLAYPLHKYGVAATALGERQGRLMSSPGALSAASQLYFDSATGKPKRGYSSESNGLRAFCKFVTNLPAHFNLTNLSADTIMAMLPEEFDSWAGRGAGGHLKPALGNLDSVLQDLNARELKPREVRVRSDLFRCRILEAYQSTCAFSGVGLADASSAFEVEAAHIVPVHRGGRDVVQNGLALSRTLHWAFDRGMIWINDDLRLSVSTRASRTPRNQWLMQFDEKPLNMPASHADRPHPDALRWHAQHVAGV